MSVEEPPHLVAEPRPSAADGIHAQLAHELGKRRTQDQLTASGFHHFGTHPGQDQAGKVAEGELVVNPAVIPSV